METDIMRMQREAEQRVRQMRERERRTAQAEPNQRTAEGLAAARAEWLSSARPPYPSDRGFVPLSDYKARQNSRREPPSCPPPERPLPAEKKPEHDGGLLAGLFKDQDQMLLLFLTILLVKNGASMELIVAFRAAICSAWLHPFV